MGILGLVLICFKMVKNNAASKELEEREALARLKKIYGASKRKTTDEELHQAGEEVFEELERKIK